MTPINSLVVGTGASGTAREEKRLLFLKKRIKWWVALMALVAVIMLGLIGVIIFDKLLRAGPDGELSLNLKKVENLAAFLGISIQAVDSDAARALGYRNGAVSVTNVLPTSPAATSGLEPGDIILRINNTTIQSTAQVQEIIAEAKPGDVLTIVVDRDGQKKTIHVKLAKGGTTALKTAAGVTTAAQKTDEAAQWGCVVAPLSADLIKQLQVPSTVRGVVVVQISAGGLAQQAGLRVGDLIVSVNRKKTPTLADFYEAIEKKDSALLEVYRAGETIYLEVKDTRQAVAPLATIAGPSSTANPSVPVTDPSTLPRRVAIAANGGDLAAQLAPRFGTAPYFIVIDLTTGRFVAIQNTATARSFATTAAQQIANEGAKAAIAGAFGSGAYSTLMGLGIVPFVASPGKVSEVLEKYNKGMLAQAAPTLSGYSYAQNTVTVAGPPSSSADVTDTTDDEEEQKGYKAKPYTIPPGGSYDPLLDPANQLAQTTAGPPTQTAAAQTTAGPPTQTVAAQTTAATLPAATTTLTPLYQNQQVTYCICPLCSTVYSHPAGTPCSSLQCPADGSRLISLSPNGGTGGSSGSSVIRVTAGPSSTTTDETTTDDQKGYKAKPYTIPPKGPYDPALDPANQTAQPVVQTAAQTVAGTVSQRVDYCYCPTCRILIPHSASVPCAQMICPQCGGRLISWDDSLVLSIAPLVQAYTPTQNQIQTRTGSATTTLLPQTATLQTATPQIDSLATQTPSRQNTYCFCPVCLTLYLRPLGVPISSLQCPDCGSRLVSLNSGGGARTTTVAGMATAGPTTIPPMGQSSMSQTTAGMITGGQPSTIPPMGQTTAGMTTGGQPSTIPPMGQTTAGMTTGGQPSTIPPMGQTTAGSPTGTKSAGQSTTVPPTGQSVAGTTTGGQPSTIPPMGQTTAGMLVGGQPTTIPPMGQTTAGAIVAGDFTSVTVAGTLSEKICIAASGATLSSPVAPLFERAPYFLIIGLGSFRAIANPNVNDKMSVGEQSAQLVVGDGATVVLTDDVGIKALNELNRLRVKVYTGIKGTAQQALEWYQAGRLTPTQLTTEAPDTTSSSHTESEGATGKAKAKAKGENSNTTL